ncbi:MAG: arylesterase, partial [Acetobacteraceae bacterium]
MRPPYGLFAALRRAAIVLLACFGATTALAAPKRLLILGDSLSAGYGLPHGEGFEAQLATALAARGLDV